MRSRSGVRLRAFKRQWRRDRLRPSNRLHRRSYHYNPASRVAKARRETGLGDSLCQWRDGSGAARRTRVIIRHHRRRNGSAKALLAIVPFMVLVVACRPSSNSFNNLNTQDVVSSTSPPFSTKEPERYRATRTTTFIEESPDGAVTKTRTSNVTIMRDGANRREEYEAAGVGTIVFLEITSGRFVMLPQARLYASQDENIDAGPNGLKAESETVSPDFLLNESTVSTEYQKVGNEVRSGRMSQKYRVITRSENLPNKSETLIWVDETLGMPIASQFVTSNANGSTRVTMELHDISTEVDPGLFVLPADYRKVAASQILSMVRAAPESAGPQGAK